MLLFGNPCKRLKCIIDKPILELLERRLSSKKLEDLESGRSMRSHKYRLGRFIRGNPKILELRSKIPQKFQNLKKYNTTDYMYLIDPDIAKSIASHVAPVIRDDTNQIVCETNAGLGLIAFELLTNDVTRIRLYEACPEFREYLKEFDTQFPGRVELFTKDIFTLPRYAYMDKMDNGNRVEQMLAGVPRRSWKDNPSVTIIGTLPKSNFVKYLIQSLVMQIGISLYGRVRLLSIIHPRDYAVFTATPNDNLHTYQSWSVLFNLFFNITLIDKYPRNAFLPWESVKITPNTRFPRRCDPDNMYLVQIDFKDTLPVTTDSLLALYFFVIRFFGKGTERIIPTLEKFVPECGRNIIDPKINDKKSFNVDMGVFTEFGELMPVEILHVFEEVINTETYKTSPFIAMIDTQLVKRETMDTSIHDSLTKLPKNIVEDVQHKFENKENTIYSSFHFYINCILFYFLSIKANQCLIVLQQS